VSPLVALRATLVRLGFLAGRLLPIRSRVVLATGHGARITGNLAWIREGVGAARPEVGVVELTFLPGRGPWHFARAAIHALRSGFHLATARLFIVDDYFFAMYVIRPRQGTSFVQVWHACGAFKKFGYSVLEAGFGADEEYARSIALHANYDLCLVSAARFAQFYAEAFRTPPERFTARLGIPRTDLFFDAERHAVVAAEVRRRYAIPDGRRVILYAPTFRGERTTVARDPTDLDLGVLREALGEDHVLLFRSHPFVAAHPTADPALARFVIDVSDYPELNDLMLVSDVLVTDYSSAIFEFALLGRPMAFFAPDLAAYEAERGFYFDYRTGVPGPILASSKDLAAYLRVGTFDIDRVRRFAGESFDVADGRATERFVTEVVGAAIPPGAPAAPAAPAGPAAPAR
jgi:CDP-ribitol ribitolphosphotransferase